MSPPVPDVLCRRFYGRRRRQVNRSPPYFRRWRMTSVVRDCASSRLGTCLRKRRYWNAHCACLIGTPPPFFRSSSRHCTSA